MSISVSGSQITFNDASTQTTAWVPGMRNRIINGDMRIDQRNAGASVTPTTSQYTIDRWIGYASQSSKYSIQQNAGAVTPVAGFVNYLGVTSLSAYSVLSGDYFALAQIIEGLNVADWGWGTANAQTVTLSFWVRSSLTGTFGGALTNGAADRSYPFTYTISSANTWEQKSITIAGDTSGTWLKTNGIGIRVQLGIGVGSTLSGTAGSWASANYLSATGATSVVGTNGATFYITGVQLEKGSTATSFDYRPYGTELALCQRYYEKSFSIGTAPANGSNSTTLSTNDGVAEGWSTNSGGGYGGMHIDFKVTKRTAPTLTAYGNSSGYWYAGGWGSLAAYFNFIGESSFNLTQQNVGGQALTYGHWAASAEL